MNAITHSLQDYCIPSNDMFLRNAYQGDLPQEIKDIDTAEQQQQDQEETYIKEYSRRKFTWLKAAMALTGAGFGIMAGAAASSFITAFTINTFVHIGAFFGAIIGYFIGKNMDENHNASRRFAIFFGKITPNRIQRITDKIEQLKKVNINNNLDKAISYAEKIAQENQSYNRFFEFMNIKGRKNDTTL